MALVYNEQEALINQIETQLQPVVAGAYTVFVEKDEIDLIRNRKIPFVNIKLRNFKIGNADNMSMLHYKRHTYEIIITFAVSAIDRKDAVIHTATSLGIWSLFNDIKARIESDLTFNGLCSTAPFQPDTAVDCAFNEDGKRWLGRGVIRFSLYKDYYTA